MPIYEYLCISCQQQFELMQKITEEARASCPICGHAEARRLVSAPQFQLKGSGWYVTDFKDSGSKPSDTKKAEVKADGGKVEK
jgi:putative FmdB family regulatory protein